ncbi:hypothetical protein HYV73_00965 [Candidatus Uhrbacteria bacterium]|nr:hypothetical protein [Candidatus Uhrbacteria bacterium]
MPFLILGFVLVAIGVYFNVKARKDKDKDGIEGTTAFIIAGLIFLLIFGLLYRFLINVT